MCFSTESGTGPAGGRLAAILGQQLVGSAVSLQGVLGVEVLRQLGLAAHQSPVLLQVLLCLESQTQGGDHKAHWPTHPRPLCSLKDRQRGKSFLLWQLPQNATSIKNNLMTSVKDGVHATVFCLLKCLGLPRLCNTSGFGQARGHCVNSSNLET